MNSTIVVRLEREEADLLRKLSYEMRALLGGSGAQDDPAVARLFPEAYESPEEAKAYKELIGDQLLKARFEALDELEAQLGATGPVDATLGASQADAWLTTVNDIRLAIGTRLGVDESKMSSEPDEGDPDAPILSVLHWLGWLQESMLGARAGSW